jgi:phosphohistidine phosphatase
MILLLMRHGIAEDRETWPGPDAARPLTREGHKKTRLAVQGLQALNPNFEFPQFQLASSPLVRARETAQIVRTELQIEDCAMWPELEDAAFEPMLSKMRQTPDQSTLVVGHEPGLSQFVSQLLTGNADALAMEWKKAAICALKVELSPAPRATLLWFLAPQQLRLSAKYK